MDYERVYNSLVNSRKDNPVCGAYFERHHIVPKSLGGVDSPSNIVQLLPREHFVAHRLLAKIYGGPMWAALAFMASGSCRSACGVYVNSKVYALAKKKMAEYYQYAMRGESNPNYGNDKVSGDKNGRYNPTKYFWQNKNTGALIFCTCFDSYSVHGMSKYGVISCISGKRKGVKDWVFLGESDKDAEKTSEQKTCTECGETKPLIGFPKDKGIPKKMCRLCYRDFEQRRIRDNRKNTTPP